MKFYIYERGGGRGGGGGKSFRQSEWGGGGVRKEFPLIKRRVRHEEFYPVLKGLAQKLSDLQFPYFVAPLPVINDRSLITPTTHMEYTDIFHEWSCRFQ